MIKRTFASALWFLAAGWGLNFVAALAGVSQVPGLAVAAAVAVFVGMDPLHLFWPVSEPRVNPRVARDSHTARSQGALAAR